VPLGLDYGLIAALCWGSTDVFATIGSRRLGSLPVTAIAQGTSLLAAIVIGIALGGGLPTDPGVLLASLFFGMVAAGAYLSFFTALRIGPLAVVSPVVAAYGGLTVVLSVLIRGESLTPLQGFGAALATAGVVLTGIVFDGGWRGTRIVGKGVVFSLVAMLLFTVLTVGMATPIRAAGWLPVVLASRLANAATLWIVLGVVLALRPSGGALVLEGSSSGPVSNAARTRAVTAAVLAGLLDVIGVVAFAIGLGVAPTWIVGLASSFGPAVAVIVAVVLWGERLRASQWVGLAGIAAGLVAVAMP
jgi:drug/metabolite transporter (DMT)-like permease